MGCSASVRSQHDAGVQHWATPTQRHTLEYVEEQYKRMVADDTRTVEATDAEIEVLRILSSKSSRRTASHILEKHEEYAEIFKRPASANLPDGSPLIAQFRRVFKSLGGDPSGAGVTASQLEDGLETFAQALAPAVAMRISLVVSDVFQDISGGAAGTITWPDFVALLERRNVNEGDHDEALSELFEVCDYDHTGRINAQELMDVLLLVSELSGRRDPSKIMNAEVAELIVRDLDCSGQGGISYAEFMEVVQFSRSRPNRFDRYSLSTSCASLPENEPHLVLHFDVNNTIMMLDTATGADSIKMLGTVFANSAWGVVEEDDEGKPKNWVLKHKDISILAPEPGLLTYKEYVDLIHPPDENASKEWNAKEKKARKALVWTFTDPGHPGERFRPELEDMNRALLLPEDVRGTPKAVAAGLQGNMVQLLPSFLHMLRELKTSGRSFTLLFRTFGHDLELVQKELNALCEGRHPLFPDDIKLDGSDGEPDYRMHLGNPGACGTFFRNPERDDIALIMGTIRQPRNVSEYPTFYEGNQDISIIEGPSAVISKVTELSGQQRTYALRDYYTAWSSMGLKSRGGKPFFLSWHDDTTHSIFFDDNITAADPKIVDPINADHWPRRFCNPQLFGVHLVQAQPLMSIVKKEYFLDCIRDCEAARRSKLRRWDVARRLLGDLASVQHVLKSLVAGTARNEAPGLERKAFQPWCFSKKVSLATHAGTFDEDCDDDYVTAHITARSRTVAEFLRDAGEGPLRHA